MLKSRVAQKTRTWMNNLPRFFAIASAIKVSVRKLTLRLFSSSPTQESNTDHN